ncbi:hypothetical protein SCLCIDRAFT_1213887 [Scleroderma citrinum Foug A]|uniref:G domain-containing protein n=1 Tax=Scleroderma citrinum Foug A TaxID=1036808 RepID=A0A0C3E5M0_9AGAM|nr:hypothetical protein SCLCIDRAFT_1213887 [Scleroderma citrinum Foug A]
MVSSSELQPFSASAPPAFERSPALPVSNTSVPPAFAPPASNASASPPFFTRNQHVQLSSNSVVESSTKPEIPSNINIVLFGETGVGNSSVINLIAGSPTAEVSADVDRCTMASTKYDILVDNASYTVYDTVGLEEPQMGVNGYFDVIEKAYSFIQSLTNAGGIHLLLFCLRRARITATVQSNYRLFHEFLCDKRVPIAFIFTGLEKEQKVEDWWSRNQRDIKKYGIHSVADARITAVHDLDDPDQVAQYRESRKAVLGILSEWTKKGPMVMDTQHWLAMFLARMATLVPQKRRPKRKDYTRVLIKRCGMEPHAAKSLTHLIEDSRP